MKKQALFVLSLLCCASLQPQIALSQVTPVKPQLRLQPPEVPHVSQVSTAVAQAQAQTTAQTAVAPAPLPAATAAPQQDPVPPPPGAAPTLSLEDALAEAYRRNPDLQAERAALRATDETYAQAYSGYRPSVTGSAGYTSAHEWSDTIHSSSDPKTLQLEVTQSLYSGGSTTADVDASENNIRAGRAALKTIEQSVLLDAVIAYMDVLRDSEIVRLNINNEDVLKNHLEAARERFHLGDITKTDVSQAESRLAAATAARVAAEGNLKTSRAGFEKTIGLLPEGLARPAMNLATPATLEDALGEALKSNPSLLRARYASAASNAVTRSAEGDKLPAVDLSGAVSRTYDPNNINDNHLNERIVQLQATMPFYGAGGALDSRVRQARQVEVERRREVDSAERTVRQDVIDAWSELAAASAQNEAQRAQIEAARMAAEGVKVETQYGSRTVLDLLDAQQEYLNAQVSYAISDRDRIVAAYGLLAAMGHLTAQDLHLNAPLYDPQKNFNKVSRKWLGTGIGKED